jgi:REP element-mobilizing transposase RayT
MRKTTAKTSRVPTVVPGGTWYHCITTTYGAWLRGDPRGFRTRHHREHVDGDYKNPPPHGLYAKEFARSVQSLKQPSVTLGKPLRRIAGEAFREKLTERGAFIVCIAVSGQHVHVLAKIPRGVKPRFLMGLGKKNSNFKLKERGWEGKLWAKRGRDLRIKDRKHQLSVYRYILAHAKEGAWVWVWKDDDAQKAHND